MIMKVFALLAFLVALCAADDDHAESAINLKDIIKKPPSNQLGNDGGKNLKCWECTTNTTMEPDESLCPDDFSNATQLNPCSAGPSFCVKHEAKGKKYFIFVCLFVRRYYFVLQVCQVIFVGSILKIWRKKSETISMEH